MFLDSTPYAVVAHHCGPTFHAGADQTASSSVWVMGGMGGCLLAIAALSAWLYKHHDRPDDSGGDDGPRGPDGSGGPPPEPPPAGPPPPDGPAWWPEFEREFAAYVAGEPEHEERAARVGPRGSAD
jgi:hypothetical protein